MLVTGTASCSSTATPVVKRSPQHLDHIAIHVDTVEEFDEAYRRLKDHGVATTDVLSGPTGRLFASMTPTASTSRLGSTLSRIHGLQMTRIQCPQQANPRAELDRSMRIGTIPS